MPTQQITGTFPQGDTPGQGGTTNTVIFETSTAPVVRTPGGVRTSSLAVQPNLTEEWTVLGWNINVSLALIAPGSPRWGVVGDLWAGLLIDNQLHDAGGTAAPATQRPGGSSFPIDLSTFAKIFNGANDYVPSVVAVGIGAPGNLGLTFMLPTPQPVFSGTMLQFALILTPSILSNVGFAVLSASYSVIYQSGARA